jgi:hypothetical protein
MTAFQNKPGTDLFTGEWSLDNSNEVFLAYYNCEARGMSNLGIAKGKSLEGFSGAIHR